LNQKGEAGHEVFGPQRNGGPFSKLLDELLAMLATVSTVRAQHIRTRSA
jgi:hypothetical protein